MANSIIDRLYFKVAKQLTRISPRINTEMMWYRTFHKRIHLKHPKMFDEKLQWMKLYYYPKYPIFTQCADKYAVRKYVEDAGCGEILNDLYGAYDSVDEIPWDKLPNQFVVKWNFGSGKNLIVRDKSKLDIPKTIKKLRGWGESFKNFYWPYSEIHYRTMPPKIIVEKLIETEDGEAPADYKVFCYNGKADCIMMCYERGSKSGTIYYFFDKKGNLIRYNKRGIAAPEGLRLENIPENFDKVFEYAEKLSKPFPFVRADFYLEKGKVTFGELTFTPCAALDENLTPEAQLIMGEKITLPKK